MQKDKRAIKTEQALLDAYVRLRRTKPDGNVTVAALCREADINRGTFYRHFQDIPAFLAAMDTRIVDDIIASINKNAPGTIGNLTAYMLDHAETVFTVLERPGGPGLSAFYHAHYKMFLKEPDLQSKFPPEQYILLYSYNVGGLFAMFRTWWKTGFAIDKEEVKKLYVRLVTQGITEVVPN